MSEKRQKNSDKKSVGVMKRLWKYAKIYRHAFVISLIAATLYVGFSLILPILFGKATDLKLRRAIKSLGGSLTTIIVSQRASAVRNADKIIVLGDGEIIGEGTADYLRETCEVYREIEASQMKEGGVR